MTYLCITIPRIATTIFDLLIHPEIAKNCNRAHHLILYFRLFAEKTLFLYSNTYFIYIEKKSMLNDDFDYIAPDYDEEYEAPET